MAPLLVVLDNFSSRGRDQWKQGMQPPYRRRSADRCGAGSLNQGIAGFGDVIHTLGNVFVSLMSLQHFRSDQRSPSERDRRRGKLFRGEKAALPVAVAAANFRPIIERDAWRIQPCGAGQPEFHSAFPGSFTLLPAFAIPPNEVRFRSFFLFLVANPSLNSAHHVSWHDALCHWLQPWHPRPRPGLRVRAVCSSLRAFHPWPANAGLGLFKAREAFWSSLCLKSDRCQIPL